eukprot:1175341-Amphidinium_carterae.2
MLSFTPHVRRPRRPQHIMFVNDEHVSNYTHAISVKLPSRSDDQDLRAYIAENGAHSEGHRSPSQYCQKTVDLRVDMDATTCYQPVETLYHGFEASRLALCEYSLPGIGGPLHQIMPIDFSIPTPYVDMATARYKIMVRHSRRALRHDRRQWFEDVCAAVAVGKGSEYSRKLHAAERMLCKSLAPQGRQIAGSNGTVHFRAQAVSAHHFGDRVTIGSQASSSVHLTASRDPLQIADLILAPDDAVRTLKSMPVRRATADAVPPLAFTSIANQLGPPLCVCSISVSRNRIAYAGAHIAPILGRKGAALQRSADRSVSLLKRSLVPVFVWGLGATWNGSADRLVDAGYASSNASAVAAFLHTHPSLLSSQESAWQPHKGVLQGHNLAALVFDVFYSEITAEIDKRRLLEPCVPHSTCMVGGVAFRDDYALARVADGNASLLKKLAHAAELVEAVHSEFHLLLNWAPGKTEATIKLTSSTAKSLYAGLCKVGALAGLNQPAVALSNGHKLAVSATYPHLGRLHAQDLKLTKEIQNRLVSCLQGEKP